MPESTPVWVTISTASMALGGVMFTAFLSLWNQKHQKADRFRRECDPVAR